MYNNPIANKPSSGISSKVIGWRCFFAPDEEKCGAFLRVQKNVVERKLHKGACADCGFAESKNAEQAFLR